MMNYIDFPDSISREALQDTLDVYASIGICLRRSLMVHAGLTFEKG